MAPKHTMYGNGVQLFNLIVLSGEAKDALDCERNARVRQAGVLRHRVDVLL